MKSGDFYRRLVTDAVLFNGLSLSLLKSFLPEQRGATVLIYHLVCERDYYDFLKIADLARLDVDLFKDQLSWFLGNGFSFITIQELSAMIAGGKEIPLKSIALTFDDCFKTTVENVLPILGSLKIKATFFITTDWIDSEVLLWQQKYYWYLKNHGLKDFFDTLKRLDGESFAGLNYTQCHNKFIQETSPQQKKDLLEQYRRPVPDEKVMAKNIYLSSKDIFKMDLLGMQIASHSCGHYPMRPLSDDLYLREMTKSKERLENLIQGPVDSFSYPFNSYRQDDDIIKKAGYKTLCTVDNLKVNKFTSLTRLPRFDAPVRRPLFTNSLRRLVYFNK